MAAKDRRLRRIDEKLPFTGGADVLATAGEAAPPAPPTIPAPQFLKADSVYLVQSAVTPRAGARLSWKPPVNGGVDSYQIQWATDSGFTSPTTLTAGAGQTDADVPGLPVNTLLYFRIRGVLRLVTGAWSNTASTTTPNDTTPPAAPTALTTSWSGLTGDLTISWANPTSANLRDVRLQIYASNGGALLREVYSATGRYVWTRAQNYADTSGSPDASVYLVLTARSWSNVFSATNLTGTATLAAPAAPSGLAVDFTGADLGVSWTLSALVAGYRLTLDGVAREVGLSSRYTYSLAQNAAEHGGTADPSISVSLVAVDALGQTSTAAATTATNAAPAAPDAVTATAFFSTLSISVTATEPADFKAYRYRLIQTLPSAGSVTWDSPANLVTRALGVMATYQVGVRVIDMFGQFSAETLSAAVAADVLTLAELRAEAIYSDSVGNGGAALKAALANDNTASGGVNYTASASWYWVQVERPSEDRYRTMTAGRFAMASGSAGLYFALSLDGVTWRWFSGPGTVSGTRITVTEVASEVAAQGAALSVTNATTITRWDLPVMVDARFMRLYVRQATVGLTLREFYPRRLVQSDDLEAESIQAINVAAGAITADKISVGSLSAISADLGTITAGSITGVTITGATIQTAASGARVELTSANGLRTLDSSGNPLVSLTGGGGLTINADASYSAARAVRWSFSGLETRQARQGAFYEIEHEVTSVLPGNIRLTALNTTTAGSASVRISQDPINSTGYGDSVTISGAGLRVGGPGGSVTAGDISASGSASLGGGLNVGAAAGAAAGQISATVNDAATNTASTVLTLGHNSTGTPAASFGSVLLFTLESSTTADRNAAAIITRWSTATDASRAGQGQLVAYDATTLREALRWGTTGSAPTISMYGVAAVARQTVTGSRGGNAALADLLTKLAATGIIIDGSTA
jgi:hypothetical protein